VTTEASAESPALTSGKPGVRRMSQWLDRIATLSAAQRAELVRALRPDMAGDASGGGGNPARLVAYVVPREPGNVDPKQLRSFLADRLPTALVPVSFVQLPALPLLPSGKLNRRDLPSPVAGRGHLIQPYRAPRTATEESICQLLSDLLGVPEVGIDDEFFELGGDSLTAIRLMGRVRHAYGVDLGANCVFEAPTAALLAARVTDGRYAAATPGQPPLLAAHATRAPLSSAQLRHWLLHMMDPSSSSYNEGDTLRLTGELDIPALERALAEVVSRHEILRTSYPTTDGQPEQHIAPPGEFTLPVADLRTMPVQARERVAGQLIALDQDRPFDLSRPPLLRARLVRLGDDEALLSIIMHHIVADEWGFKIFYTELAALYEAARDKRPCPLPPVPAQYADYAVWEGQMLSLRLAEGLDYWRSQLRTAPTASVLGPATAPATTAEACLYQFEVPDELTGRLAAWCRSRSVTIFVACLAAFTAVLGRYGEQEDVVVGVPFANREQRGLDNMIGCFINPAALRIDLAGVTTPETLVARADRAVEAGYAMQHVPFEKVTNEVRLARTEAGLPGAGAPLFDVVLNFIAEPAVLQVSGVRTERSGGPPLTAKYGLTLYLEKKERVLAARMVSQPDRISKASVVALAREFLLLLGQMSGQPAGARSAGADANLIRTGSADERR
jgi:acyl carrier protein